jgi:hypothetical protein
MEDRLRPMKPWCVAGKPPCIDVNFSVVFIREVKQREKGKRNNITFKILKINFGLQTETGDQVIGIHSAGFYREVHMQIQRISSTVQIQVQFFINTQT